MYVHFEGLDLAGKSTVCRWFKEHAKGHWEIRRNALTQNNALWAVSDEMRKSARYSDATVGWCFYAALRADLEDYRRPAGNVIQDSTILLRSMAYHAVIGTPGLVDALQELVDRHPRFDRSFVCTASREARLARLAIRRAENLGPEDFKIRDQPEQFAEMENALVQYAVKWFGAKVIDTSGDLKAGEGLSQITKELPDIF
jgi:thymidylate kinase